MHTNFSLLHRFRWVVVMRFNFFKKNLKWKLKKRIKKKPFGILF